MNVKDDKYLQFDIIVVIYNRYIETIPWLDKVRDSQYVDNIIICDNSDLVVYRIINEKAENITYINMQGNKGLSNAYNIAVKKCVSPHIVILDDDTELPDDFADKVAWSIRRHQKADIVLPIVKSNKVLMSPCKKGIFRFSEIKDLNKIPNKISGINSGMIIKKELFNRIKYRESLFLDMVDHAFMDDARKLNAAIEIDKTIVLKQDYSRETDSHSSAVMRYKITSKDERTYYSSSLFGKAYCELHLLYLKLKMKEKRNEHRI